MTSKLPGASRRLAAAFAALVLAAAGSAIAAPPPPVRPSVLFLGKPGIYLEVAYLRELEEHGFDVDSAGWGAVTPEFLRRYNVVVITAFIDDSANVEGGVGNGENGFGRTRQRLVGEYLKAGGGVLVFLNTTGCYGKGKLGTVPEWLKTFDVDFYAETVDDPQRAVPTTVPSLQRYSLKFAWTDRFAQHPVTAGVRHLWYPVGWGGHVAAAMAPVTCGHQWEKLVQTGPDARIVGPGNDVWEDLYRQAPPAGPHAILAVRQANLGRLAVTGVHPLMTVWSPYHPALGSVVMKAGQAGKPSDFWLLFENLYRWLAEPSLQMGSCGPAVAKLPPLPGATPAIAWSQLTFPPTPAGPRPYFRGHVGAHTALSTGKGTVAEWAAAARQAGFSFLILTEDLAAMDEAKWKQLQADCRAATTPEFVAWPGLEYRNAAGHRGFMPVGYREWLPQGWLTDDGKRVNIDRGWAPGKGWGASKHQSGQIMLFLTWFCNGFFDFARNPTPSWDYKLYSLFPVWSAERGKPLDDALDQFLHASSLHVNPAAYALDLVYDPADLATVIPQGRPHLVVSALPDPRVPEAPTLANVVARQVVTGTPDGMNAGCYRGWTGPVATQGPALRLLFRGGYQWEGVELPRYWIERHTAPQEADWFMPSWYRLKLRVEADSAAGLREIALYDGETLFRRFDAGGAPQFTAELDVVQCPTRHLIAVATDTAGRRAVTREVWLEQQMTLYNYCGDRVNAPGSIYQPIHGHPYLDPYTKRREVRRFFVDLVAPDLYVERYTTDWLYREDQISDEFGWHNWAPHHPREDLTFSQRAFGWCQRHGGAVSYDRHPSQAVYWDGFVPVETVAPDQLPAPQLRVYESELTLKQPAAADPEGFVNRSVMSWEIPLAADQSGYLAVIPETGAPAGQAVPADHPLAGPLPLAAVVALGPAADDAHGVSVFVRGEGLGYHLLRRGDKAVLKIGRTAAAAPAPGVACRWRLEEINRQVTPAMVRTPQIDVAHGTRADGLTLCEQHLAAVDGAAVVRVGAATVPDTNCLPLVVAGLNARWTAVLYEPGAARCRPVGVWNGAAHVQVPATTRDTTLVIGNLVRASAPEVRVEAVQESDDAGRPTGAWLIDAHNPTAAPLDVTFTVPPAFDLIRTREHRAAIPAGASVAFRLE